jgi:hypothetical protein
MKKSIAISVCLLGAAGIYWFAQAGEMEPPGPPAPTMRKRAKRVAGTDSAIPSIVTGRDKTVNTRRVFRWTHGSRTTATGL